MKNICYSFILPVLLLLTAYSANAQNKIKYKSAGEIKNSITAALSIVSKADTLSYSKTVNDYNTIFNLEGQDIISAWFVCPFDLTIKAVGIDCGENISSVNSQIKIVKMNKVWTEEKLKVKGSENLGYWINNSNPNNIFPYEQDAASPKKWISNTIGSTSPFEEDLWSDNGQESVIMLQSDGNTKTYQWIEMYRLNFDTSVKKGEVFAVCIKNMEPKESGKTLGIMATNELDYGIFKFYANGRTPGDLSTAGWWKRDYLVNIAVAVEITGDLPPDITVVDELPSTLSKEPRTINATIIDSNPSGGVNGVQKGFVQYFLNKDTTWKEVQMTNISGDIYTGIIPAQSGGTNVTYRIKAVDVNGNISFTERWYSYYIFAPTTGVKSLLVFNGRQTEGLTKYPLANYFEMQDAGRVYSWAHDTWIYGPLTEELVNNYSNIFEITNSDNSGSDIIYNDDVIKKWLSGNSGRNYALTGQEWLGARNGFVDRDFSAGTFEYDILGITHSYNDVADLGSSLKPSRVFAKQGSLLGDELFQKFSSWGTDSLQYDPYYELNKTENWIDGFEVLSGQPIDAEVETRLINGTAKKQNVTSLSHRVLSMGNKIAFFSFDPIAVNTKSPSTNSKYFRFGSSTSSPQMKVLSWFNVLTDIKDEDISLPAQFKLCQNYPNPFNPRTTIQYVVSSRQNVVLKVYDVLGKEISCLVNEEKQPGIYKVEFDGSRFASGIYFYRLSTPKFTSVKKLLLLK